METWREADTATVGGTIAGSEIGPEVQLAPGFLLPQPRPAVDLRPMPVNSAASNSRTWRGQRIQDYVKVRIAGPHRLELQDAFIARNGGPPRNDLPRPWTKRQLALTPVSDSFSILSLGTVGQGFHNNWGGRQRFENPELSASRKSNNQRITP